MGILPHTRRRSPESASGPRPSTALTLARSEIEALKTERTRALRASADSAHVVEAKGTADQDQQDQGRANLASGPEMVRPAEPASQRQHRLSLPLSKSY